MNKVKSSKKYKENRRYEVMWQTYSPKWPWAVSCIKDGL